MEFSIIVPAFNEEDYLGTTLHAVQAASMELSAHSEDVDVELIVVDNNSGDATAAIVRDKGAQVVHEPVQGIARARNTGARHAGGDVLIFVDADVLMTPELLRVIHTALDDPDCIGGGVDVDYRARRLFVRLYLLAWRPSDASRGWCKAPPSSAVRVPSIKLEATTRMCGWVKT